jgi:drug/metabolite transporter (DMT)-like permease
MNPLFGVLLSAIILQEGSQAFSLQGIMALLLVVIGIMVVNLKGKNQKYQKN